MNESTDLVPVERWEPATVEPQVLEIHRKLKDQRFLALLSDVYFKGCDEVEIEFCLETCRHLGLDPIAKQIWFVRIWDRELGREVLTPIIGIAGLRAAAHRTGQYGGPLDPLWCGPDGVWRDVWLEQHPPAAAKVAVRRHGFEQPVTGVVTYASAVQTTKSGQPRNKWRTAPVEMLAKCAEALAIRRAFSLEVSANVKVDEVDHYETAADRAFRVDLADHKGLIEQMRAAATAAELNELGRAAAALPECEEKSVARDVWAERSRQLAAPKKAEPKRAEQKKPQPEHDYGPPPMTDDDAAEAQEAFGFGDKGGS
jgi:phage recombination protein Bet